jgi:hypothetical protein
MSQQEVFNAIGENFSKLKDRTEKLIQVTSPDFDSVNAGWAGLKCRTDVEKELQNIINDLNKSITQTEKPEIRVLLLGPLKSGKSTLMNILAKSPKVSQVDPRPSYPCFVEVSHSDESEPSCRLYKDIDSDNKKPDEKLTLKDTRDKLDILLDNYIKNKVISYRLLKTTINLSNSNKELVLIDSPGLYFGNSASGYNWKSSDYLKKADVAVYVVRIEQLFTAQVNDHIKEIGEDLDAFTKMKFFLIVNGTRKAVVVNDDGEKEDYDQIEHSDEFKTYLHKHVLDEGISGKIAQEKTMEMGFADFNEEWFNVWPLGEAGGKGPKSEILTNLVEYLNKNLIEVKKQNLTHAYETRQTEFKGCCGEVINCLNVFHNNLGEKIREVDEGIKGNDEKISKVKNNIETLRKKKDQINKLKEDCVSKIYPPGKDTETEKIMIKLSTVPPPDSPALDGKILMIICQKSYKGWYGVAHRTLHSLFTKVWEEEHPVSGEESGKKIILRDCWAKFAVGESRDILRNLSDSLNHEKGETTDYADIVKEAVEDLENKITISDWFLTKPEHGKPKYITNLTNLGSDELRYIPLEVEKLGIWRKFLTEAEELFSSIKEYANKKISSKNKNQAEIVGSDNKYEILWGGREKSMSEKVAKIFQDDIIQGMQDNEGWGLNDLTDKVKCMKSLKQTIFFELNDRIPSKAVKALADIEQKIENGNNELEKLNDEKNELSEKRKELNSAKEKVNKQIGEIEETIKAA